tara:strand:+ start:118 stop:345 length:228 start_codon:yes stop_codon:yes gene_type:complete
MKPKLELSYTDLIAVCIKEKLQNEFPLTKYDGGMQVDGIKWDLHKKEGYYLSSKKTILVNYLGKGYKITIEENEN